MGTMDSRDDCFNMESGDLGLGHGLLPGALSTNDSPIKDGLHHNRTVISVRLDTPVCLQTGIAPQTESETFTGESEITETPKNETRPRLRWSRKKTNSKSDTNNPHSVVVTSPADVLIGTSLRQQKLLYEHDLDDIIRKNSESDHQNYGMHSEDDVTSNHSHNQDKNPSGECGEKIVLEKLTKAQLEIDLLRQDLELCQRQLHSKYQAIEILQKQVFSSGQIPVRLREFPEELGLLGEVVKEIQKLQFDLEYKQSTLLNSQELWAERFDRVCQENLSLAAQLESKNDDIRRLVAERMMLARERDELLALLDIHERQQFESSHSISSEDAYFNFSSTELALLGACHCRVAEPDPCGCSHAAVALQREIGRLKCDIAIQKQRRDEALVTTDAYRIAFEQQLSKSSNLLKKLAELTSRPLSNKSPKKSQKGKGQAALKWLLENLHNDEQAAKNISSSVLENDVESPEEDQIILLLVDMVCDKSEALAHQRLATRMLAGKTKELENKLDTIQDNVFQEERASNG